MFAQFVNEKLPKILEDTKGSPHLVIKDLDDVFVAIDSYLVKEKLMYSVEPVGSQERRRVYGHHIFHHANELANIVTKLNMYVQLNTDVRNKIFTLIVDGTRAARFYNIEDQYIAIMKAPREGKRIIISPEIELINTYHRLYSPQYEPEWDSIGEHEGRLWKMLASRRRLIIDKPAIKGGAADSGPDLVGLMMSWLRSEEGRRCVLIGSRALDMLRKTQRKTRHRTIQIISPNHADTAAALVAHFGATGVTLRKIKYDVKVPHDHRLKKITLKAHIDGRDHYVANIYNSAEYELVPYVEHDSLRVAAPLVLLRFLLIDIWLLRFLAYNGTIKIGQYRSSAAIIVQDTSVARDLWRAAGDALPVYIGTYIDIGKALRAEKTPFPYYPEVYKRDRGSYRVV